jgi:hypothetical protein
VRRCGGDREKGRQRLLGFRGARARSADEGDLDWGPCTVEREGGRERSAPRSNCGGGAEREEEAGGRALNPFERTCLLLWLWFAVMMVERGLVVRV